MINIRTANPGDETGIGTVHALSWKETYQGLMPQDFLDNIKASDRISMWEKSLKKPEVCQRLWVAEHPDEGIIGFCNGGEPRDNFDFDCEIYAIYLYKKFHGQGIGKKLFQKAAESFKTQNKKKLYLWVLDTNPTINVYKALGGIQGPQIKKEKIGHFEITEVLYSFNL